MAYSNTTPHYGLPQFVASDEPSWLTDVNEAMLAIDTQMNKNASSGGDAESSAGAALEAAQAAQAAANNAQSAAQSAVEQAAEAKSQASTAQTTAIQAQTQAQTAATAADNALSKADEAETQANTAISAASAAQTSAGTALTTANSALTSAGEAHDLAADAVADAASNTQLINTLSSALTNFQTLQYARNEQYNLISVYVNNIVARGPTSNTTNIFPYSFSIVPDYFSNTGAMYVMWYWAGNNTNPVTITDFSVNIQGSSKTIVIRNSSLYAFPPNSQRITLANTILNPTFNGSVTVSLDTQRGFTTGTWFTWRFEFTAS